MNLLLATYLHTLSPFAVRFGESTGIRWYGLSYIAGFIAGWLLIRQLAKRGKTPMKVEQVADFVFAVAFGTVIGGRLGYCVFYQPALFTEFLPTFPYWGVLALNHGGMASHGGLIGIVIACVIYARRHRNIPGGAIPGAGVGPIHLLDLCAWVSTVGIFFGRIANFVNGELVGREAPAGLPWAVKFPQDMRDWSAAQLGELTAKLEPLGITAATPGALVDRAIDAIQHGNPKVIGVIEPMLLARHPSQLYEALMEGLTLFVLLGIVWMKPRKPGVVGGWFLIGYATVRILGENFRMPDAIIANEEFAHWGVTRGQLLSFVMLSVGVVYLMYFAARKAPKLGGWMTKSGKEASNDKSRKPETSADS
ncbi:MAG: prolipoprotein diacylglyceryl transferase [Phycisphaerales bacterium]